MIPTRMPEAAESWFCRSCSSLNAAWRLRCERCGVLVAAPSLGGRQLPSYDQALAPAPPPPKSRWPKTIAVIGGVAVVGAVVAASTVAIVKLDPFGRGGDYPSAWDPRAAGFIRFVEETTGHEYDHPVDIRFLPDHEFEELVAQDPESLDDETKLAIANVEAQARALGLISGSTDLAAEQNEVTTNGTLGYYSFEDHEVVMRLPEGLQDSDVKTADDLPFGLHETMVHELTHVLQDQIYDIDKLTEAAITDEEYSALLGLIEGHAEYVAERYITEELTAEEEDEYDAAQDELRRKYQEDTAEVTPLLTAARSAPYVLGPPFVAAVDEAGDLRAVDEAFADPPITERELMHPALYVDGIGLAAVEVAEPPDDAEMLGGDTLGSTTLYFMLSVGLPAHHALQAVDGAAADAYSAYRLADQVCIDIAVAAVDAAAADKLEWGLTAWSNARPAEAQASAIRDGNTLTIHACDPGAETDQIVPATEAIDQLFGRSVQLGFYLQKGWDLDRATCVTNGLFYEFSDAQLHEFSDEVEDFYSQLDASCV